MKKTLVDSRDITPSWPIYICLFSAFIAGAILSKYVDINAYLSCNEPVILYTIAFALILIFSASVHGIILIPFCCVLFGLAVGATAEILCAEVNAGYSIDVRLIILNLFCVPAYFSVALKGIRTSSILCKVLAQARTVSREEYIGKYFKILIYILVSFLFIYYLMFI